jgi:hypothetical protein
VKGNKVEDKYIWNRRQNKSNWEALRVANHKKDLTLLQ